MKYQLLVPKAFVTHESASQQVIDQMKFSLNKNFVFLLKNLFSAKMFTHDVEASLWHMPLRFFSYCVLVCIHLFSQDFFLAKKKNLIVNVIKQLI